MKWKFNEQVAAQYNDIVNKNIPNYNTVIEKCMMIINTYKPDASIIDVGCANGQTMKYIKESGWKNIVGVDNSSDMVENINDFKVFVSDTLPDLKFDVILCNWVLHFICDLEKRADYIKDAYSKLNPGGTLIISDKIKNDYTYFYHVWKYKQGLTIDEINHKAEQIDGVLCPKPITWYNELFEEMGIDFDIIDAHWCFNTFVIRKR